MKGIRWPLLVLVAFAGCAEQKPAAAPGKTPGDDSELKVVDLKEGMGPAAKFGDLVEVHYTGWLLKDGKKFDSSLDSGRPFTFRVGAGRVIKGWDQGVEGMKVGGKRKLTIPAELAYGSKGMGEIPPYAVLVFEIELLRIEEP